MYAVGGNAEASRYSGIDVRRVRLMAFAFCGIGAAAAGHPPGGQHRHREHDRDRSRGCSSRSPRVFLGMAMFRGGRPNLPGTVLGVILLRVIDNGLNFTDIHDSLQSAISGLVIVIAVLPPAVGRLRAAR